MAIDDDTLRNARVRALQQGTSVNAVIRDFLESYAGGQDQQRQAIDTMVEIAGRSPTGSDATGRTWTRDDLYEERSRWPPS